VPIAAWETVATTVSKSFAEVFVRNSSCLLFAVFVALSMPAMGVRAAEEFPDTLVVTATRVPTPELEVASSITVVSAEDIAARQYQTLPDVLKQVPGLNLVQTGGPGGQTSVFMRGTNSNHTKVLVDGIDVSDPSNSGGAFDFGQFLTQDIEKVEILRGPQSGLYGSDAIGGVINIITKSGAGPTQLNARIEAGSFDSFNQSGGVSGSAEQFHYAANVEHMHSGEIPVTPLELLAPGERRIDDYYDNFTASTKLGFDLSEHADLGLVARYTDTHLRITGENFDLFPAPDQPDSAQSPNNTVQFYARASAHWGSFAGLLDQTLGAAYSNVKTSDFSPENPRSDTFGERVKFDWQGIIQIAKDEKLVLGAEHQRDEITSPILASTRIDSGYVELQSGFAGQFFDALSLRFDDNDRFGSKLTYRFAPEYLLTESGTKIKSSIGSGFKAPTLNQLFQSFPDFGFFANPNLKAESSLGWDVGFEQALASNALHFGATYFRNDIKNLITDNVEFTTDINVGRARTEGIESFVSYQPLQSLLLRLDYTYTQAEDEIARQELLRRPKHKASLNAAWAASSQLALNATLLSVSSWIDGNRDFSVEPLTAPGYTIVDLAGSYDLAVHWAVYARIENLFDRRYQNPDGFLQPSRGVFAGIKTKF
jgi:vitamin B12 transporter